MVVCGISISPPTRDNSKKDPFSFDTLTRNYNLFPIFYHQTRRRPSTRQVAGLPDSSAFITVLIASVQQFLNLHLKIKLFLFSASSKTGRRQYRRGALPLQLLARPTRVKPGREAPRAAWRALLFILFISACVVVKTHCRFPCCTAVYIDN